MPDNTSEIWEYDREGRCIKHTDRNGSSVEYKYGIYGNLLSAKNCATGDENMYQYAANGLLIKAEGGGIRYHYEYDRYGRLTEKKAGGKNLLQQGYDKAGRRAWLTDHTGKTTEYRYDTAGRITNISDNGIPLAEYVYNPNGTVKRKQIGNCLTTEYTYDRDQSVTGIKTTFGKQLLTDNQYHYNRNGMCLEKQTLQGRYTYAYDSQSRLTVAEMPKMKESYGYDDSGNRLWQEISGKDRSVRRHYEYDNCNRLLKEVTKLINGKPDTTEGRELTKHYTYDKQGNLLSDGNIQYTYDGFNQMVKAEDLQGNIQKNRYDAEGLRYEMEENERLFHYIYDEREIITEETGQDVIRYIRGYDLISSDSERARTYYHYAADELGSITHVVNGNTPKIENVYEYDSFGNTVHADENVHNPFRYTGQQYDSLTGLYYLRARFYNPATARFTQEDSYYGDGLNLYAYCNNNPVNYYDPEGHASTCPIEALKKETKEQIERAKNWWQKSTSGSNIVPTVKSGNFEKWFDSLSCEELNTLWKNKKIRKAIEKQLRAPGGMHEWLMVSRAPVFKSWGITAEKIRELRTAIPDVEFVNPYGKHGKIGSTKAHNEILKIIDSSKDYDSFVKELNIWADNRLKGGRESLPKGLKIKK